MKRQKKKQTAALRIITTGLGVAFLTAFSLPEWAYTQETPDKNDRTNAATTESRDSVNTTPELRQEVLPQVMVTGEKITRSIQDTASSVTAVNAEDLESRKGAASVNDVISDTPNVTYTHTVGAPIIRGQDTQGPNSGSTAFFGGTIPRATINLDGHYLNYYEYVFGATSIWDVDNLEVFRGPQTTSQGANAIAGAIIVNTKDPTFKPEGAFQVEAGSNNRQRASLALSGPLVKDELAARLAIDYWGRDTFIDYINGSFAKGATDHDFKTMNARAKLLWKPQELSALTIKLSYAHTYNNRPTGEAASLPYHELNSKTATMPSWEQNTDSGILDVGYDFRNGLKLFNQSQYSYVHVDRVAEPAANGTAVVDQQNMTNETRLLFGNANATISNVTGLYLARTTSENTLYSGGTSRFDDTKENIGLYSEMTIKLTDRWKLTGGLRYQRDQIERSGSSSYATVPLSYNKTFDALLPKITLSYAITPDITLGALVSKGYNPGGVNLSLANRNYLTFSDETVWNYELFSRARFLNGRLAVTGNLFYSDYHNSQRLLPDYLNGKQYGSVAVNADRAEAYGLELGVDSLILDNLRLRAGVGLLHTEIGTFTDAAGKSYKGNEFGNAPGYMLNFGADWDIVPQIRLMAELRHTDGYYSTDENKAAYAVKSYTIANTRVIYTPFKMLELYGYVNNILDKRAATYLSDDRSVGGIVANMTEPRTFGVGMKVSF